MPLGVVQVGATYVLTVSTTLAGTYSPISDLNSFNKTQNRTIASFPVLQRAVAYSIPGTAEETYQASGYLSVGDTGQDLLRAASVNNTTVFIKGLHNGTDGFVQEVRVGSRSMSVAPDGLVGATFELAAVGVATVIAGGPIP